MGNHSGKRELLPGEPAKEAETHEGEAASHSSPATTSLSPDSPEDNDVFGEADVNQNNELGRPPRKGPAVTASTGAAEPRGGWPKASPADPGGRPHLVRLFSRDAPGREDNTFKERPSESDELQPIREDGGATAPADDAEMMASQKRSSQRHGSKYLATASGLDHGRHGYRPRHRDTGFLDSLGRFFGGDRRCMDPEPGTTAPCPTSLSMADPVTTTQWSISSRTSCHPGHHPQPKPRGEDWASPDLAGAPKGRSPATATATVAGPRTTKPPTRATREATRPARAHFPESSSWVEETVGPDPPWPDADAPRGLHSVFSFLTLRLKPLTSHTCLSPKTWPTPGRPSMLGAEPAWVCG